MSENVTFVERISQCCHVPDIFLSRLELVRALIWLISRLKMSKISKHAFLSVLKSCTSKQ